MRKVKKKTIKNEIKQKKMHNITTEMPSHLSRRCSNISGNNSTGQYLSKLD